MIFLGQAPGKRIIGRQLDTQSAQMAAQEAWWTREEAPAPGQPTSDTKPRRFSLKQMLSEWWLGSEYQLPRALPHNQVRNTLCPNIQNMEPWHVTFQSQPIPRQWSYIDFKKRMERSRKGWLPIVPSWALTSPGPGLQESPKLCTPILQIQKHHRKARKASQGTLTQLLTTATTPTAAQPTGNRPPWLELLVPPNTDLGPPYLTHSHKYLETVSIPHVRPDPDPQLACPQRYGATGSSVCP